MFRITVCLIAAASCLSQVKAAEIPVEAFPADSAIVARIADVDKTTAKIKELVGAIEPTQAAQADLISAMSGTLIDNPAKLGVKQGSDWWFAAIPNENPKLPPSLIIAVQVEDVAVVKDAVGDAYTYVEYTDWLIYTKDAEAGKAVQACVSDGAANISKAADLKAQKMVMAADAAVFINIEYLVEKYKTELQGSRDLLNQTLQQAAEEVENSPAQVPGMDIGAIMDMYTEVAGYLLDAVYDARNCVVGISISKEGIHFDEYLAVKADSPTAKFLAKHPPSALSSLKQLPPNELVYTGFHFDMTDFTKWGLEMMETMFGKQEGEGLSKDEIIAKFQTLGVGAYVGSFQLGNLQSGLFKMAAIYDVKNGKEARSVYKEMMKVFGSIDSPLIKQTMTYEENAEELDGTSVDKLTIKQELGGIGDPDNPQAAQAQAMQQMAMQMMYGPDGPVTRMIYLDNQVVATTGGGLDALSTLLKSVNEPKSSAAFDATRSKLGDQSNLLIMIDLPSMIARGVEAAAATGLLPPGALNLGDIQPSYLGYSLSISDSGLEVDAHLPAEQIKGLYEIGMQGFMMYQGLQQQ